MKVLITGSNGFLGEYITKSFELSNFQIFELNRKNQKVDLTKNFSLHESNFDVVVHCAGKAHIYPKNKAEIDQFYLINYIGTQNLCTALEEKKVKQFIFISTVSIYGSKGKYHKESDIPNIESPYAHSKLKAEKYLIEWGNKNNIPIIILRLPLVVGFNPPGNLGKMISSMKNGTYVSINNGKCIKSAVLAEDVAKFIPTLMGINGIYNLSDSCDISFSEFEQHISNQLDKKRYLLISLRIAKFLGRIGDLIKSKRINSDLITKLTTDFTVNCNKAKKELGWNPRCIKNNLDLFFKIN